LTAYTTSQIDHVDLRLLRASGGSYTATGAVLKVAPGALTTTLSLENLRLATSYEIEADAYADAAETQLISDPTSSLTTFTTPAVQTSTSGDTVDDTPDALLAINLTLATQTYAGTASFDLKLSNPVKKKASVVDIALVSGTTTVASEAVSPASVDAGQTLTLSDLRMGTAYKLEAAAYDSKGKLLSNASKSDVSFTTPAIASGAVDTQSNTAPYTLPCQ
ncbi:MAG TPA: hypothetical protein V6D47_10805, partial [Oscillatoriaceae cyanobacterium]